MGLKGTQVLVKCWGNIPDYIITLEIVFCFFILNQRKERKPSVDYFECLGKQYYSD